MIHRLAKWFVVLGLTFLLVGSTSAQTIVVETFDAGASTGSVVPGSTWDGNVTQNAGSITVGGDALDENGWFAPAVNLDATGMNVLTVTAQRDSGNVASSVAIQFEDTNLNTSVFSIATSQFAVGQLTTVHLTLTGWTSGFDFTQITGWNFGGGSPGIVPFRLTIDEILLEAEILTAPEITSSTTDETVDEGAAVSFAVTATGTDPLAYQWFKDGVAITGNASAATATLTFGAVTPADAGTYTCRVSNALGDATSGAFNLTVRPQATVVLSGLETTYTGEPRVVTATTEPTGLIVEVTYDGATTAPTDAGSYAVVATVIDDSYIGSASGTLVVAKRTPVITWDAGGPINDGDPLTAANLAATADVDGTFVFDPPAGTTLATGEHTLTAQFTPTDTANHLPVSTTRLLAVGTAAPAILSGPSARTTILGQRATFTVSAVGSGTLMYSWTKDGASLPDATAATLELTDLTLADAGTYAVEVSNAAGAAPVQSAQLTVLDVELSHAAVSSGYVPGAAVEITNTVRVGDGLSVSQLTWSVLPPPPIESQDWSFESSAGDTSAATRPTAGDTDLFEWNWTTVSTSPLSFTYTTTAPGNASGSVSFTAMANLTVNGNAIDAMVRPDPLQLEPQATQHSADIDGDFALNLPELLRVIELYNTRFGTTRTGRYRLDGSSEDGFAPDSTSGAGEPTTLGEFHSADSDRDGLVSLAELLRVIELYNTREGTTRTGRYHIDGSSEDGFAPGPQ